MVPYLLIFDGNKQRLPAFMRERRAEQIVGDKCDFEDYEMLYHLPCLDDGRLHVSHRIY